MKGKPSPDWNNHCHTSIWRCLVEFCKITIKNTHLRLCSFYKSVKYLIYIRFICSFFNCLPFLQTITISINAGSIKCALKQKNLSSLKVMNQKQKFVQQERRAGLAAQGTQLPRPRATPGAGAAGGTPEPDAVSSSLPTTEKRLCTTAPPAEKQRGSPWTQLGTSPSHLNQSEYPHNYNFSRSSAVRSAAFPMTGKPACRCTRCPRAIAATASRSHVREMLCQVAEVVSSPSGVIFCPKQL